MEVKFRKPNCQFPGLLMLHKKDCICHQLCLVAVHPVFIGSMLYCSGRNHHNPISGNCFTFRKQANSL